mmetsp:Transcript_23322/g.28599  ORF Transcript_23322/g.28599 Transcript_23322/m.28599 type:complete len:329 (-) Transcript_23322:22-1008(-)
MKVLGFLFFVAGGVIGSTYVIPNENIDIDCGNGYTLSIINSSETKLHLEMANCAGFGFTHIKDISKDDCYLYDNKYTNIDIINFIEAGLNTSKSEAVLTIATQPDVLTLSLDISVDILSTIVSVDMFFTVNEVNQTDLISMINNLKSDLQELNNEITIQKNEINTLNNEISTLKNYSTITILWDLPKTNPQDQTVPAGWLKIPLNYISLSDSNIVLNPTNNAISVTSGVYDIEAKLVCHRCQVFHIQIRLGNGMTIPGSSASSNPTNGDSVSFIPKQSIQLSNPTDMELWLYSKQQGWIEHAFNNVAVSVQNDISLRYATAVSIKKLS